MIDPWLILRYGFLVFLANLVAGIIYGTIRIAVLHQQMEPWGAVSVGAALKALLSIISTCVVYWFMARRHPTHYFINGIGVAVLAAATNFTLGLLQAPSPSSVPNPIGIFCVVLVANLAAFVAFYGALKAFGVVGANKPGAAGGTSGA